MNCDGLSLFAFCFVCLAIGAVIGAEIVRSETVYQRELIERGLALYCPHNGQFAWKGECDESGR